MSSTINPREDIKIFSLSSKSMVYENNQVNPKANEEEQKIAQKLANTIRTIADFFWEKYKIVGINKKGNVPRFNIGWDKNNAQYSFAIDGNKVIENFKFKNDLAVQEEIVAHEYMHGVTNWLNPLEYAGEPGAINEGISDIFAITIKRKVLQKDDWTIGDNIRDLSRKFAMEDVKDATKIEKDFGYVHHNSNIISHHFYLTVSELEDYDRSYGAFLKIWWNTLAKVNKNVTFREFAEKNIEMAFAYGAELISETVKKKWKELGVL